MLVSRPAIKIRGCRPSTRLLAMIEFRNVLSLIGLLSNKHSHIEKCDSVHIMMCCQRQYR